METAEQKALARLMRFVKISDCLFYDGKPCWEWQGHRNKGSYGRFYYKGRLDYAHIVSFQLHGNQIPKGFVIDHLCRIEHCVNPAHLEAVPEPENHVRKNRQTDAELELHRQNQELMKEVARKAVIGLDNLRMCI